MFNFILQKQSSPVELHMIFQIMYIGSDYRFVYVKRLHKSGNEKEITSLIRLSASKWIKEDI